MRAWRTDGDERDGMAGDEALASDPPAGDTAPHIVIEPIDPSANSTTPERS